jgi:hypothetical protein
MYRIHLRSPGGSASLTDDNICRYTPERATPWAALFHVLDSQSDTSLAYSRSCLTMCRFLQLNLSGLDSYRCNLYEPGSCYVCTIHLVKQTHPWGKVSPSFLFINSQVRFPELKNFILLHRFLFFYLFPLFGGRKQTFLVRVLVTC